MKWRYEELEAFVEVVDRGSVTAAADRLGLSKSVISKRISDLEASVGAGLFLRSSQTVRPTERALALHQRLVPLLRQMQEASMGVARQSEATLTGQLRVTAPVSFGMRYVTGALAEFCRDHPDLDLIIDFDDQVADLVRSGYDLAIRMGYLPDSSLKARKLCDCPRVICCSPAYAERFGIPSSVDELADHACIDYAYVHATRFWRFQKDDGTPFSVSMRSRIVANNSEAIRDLAISGLGIVSIPSFLASDALGSGALVEIELPQSQPPYTIAAVYPPTQHVTAKVRRLIDHLVEVFATQPWGSTAPIGAVSAGLLT